MFFQKYIYYIYYTQHTLRYSRSICRLCYWYIRSCWQQVVKLKRYIKIYNQVSLKRAGDKLASPTCLAVSPASWAARRPSSSWWRCGCRSWRCWPARSTPGSCPCRPDSWRCRGSGASTKLKSRVKAQSAPPRRLPPSRISCRRADRTTREGCPRCLASREYRASTGGNAQQSTDVKITKTLNLDRRISPPRSTVTRPTGGTGGGGEGEGRGGEGGQRTLADTEREREREREEDVGGLKTQASKWWGHLPNTDTSSTSTWASASLCLAPPIRQILPGPALGVCACVCVFLGCKRWKSIVAREDTAERERERERETARGHSCNSLNVIVIAK